MENKEETIDSKEKIELEINTKEADLEVEKEEIKETNIEEKINEIEKEKTNKTEEKEDDKIVDEQNNIIENKEEIEAENNVEIYNEKKSKHEKEKKFSAKKIIIVTLLIVIMLFVSTIFAILNMSNSKVMKGVYIENVNVSNLTKEELKNIINQKIEELEDIELCFGEYSTIVKLEEAGLEINSKETIDKVMNLGKTNNIVLDNYQIMFAALFGKHFDLVIDINQEKFDEMIKYIQAEIPESIKAYSYEIKDKELIITNGKPGEKIIEIELKDKIIKNIINQFNGKKENIEIPTIYSNPEKIDIEKIYNEVYKEAQDAYILEGESEEIIELHKEEDGIDFAITIEEAKELLKEDKEKYIIPLKINKPKIEISDLGDKLFKQTLAKYTTIYDAGNANRSHNIELAAKTINGTILMPGEIFSYNGILGNTNKEKGYKVGTAYVGGKVVESYGGGICQVSSTLYNSVLYANLEIVERHNHSYVVNYVPAGRDATVAYGGKNFRFKNTRNYPIKIVANAKNGVVSISIKGIKEETEYEVVLTSTVLSTTPRTVVYENNSSLAEGTEKVIQKGYDGKKSIAYKILKLNGATISKTVLSKDTYKPMAKIIQVGTKKVVTTQTSNPETSETTSTAQ